MRVVFGDQSYNCTKAVREENRATLYLIGGGTAEFCGVADNSWDKFQLEGGDWELIATVPSNTERLDALESAMLALMEGMVNV